MVLLEKSLPGPECLLKEKELQAGNYRCGDVLKRLKDDFKNKCYICEYKEPVTINVEHFKPHNGDKELKFDWSNLFWACAHCNNTKLNTYTNLLNCTNEDDQVDRKLKYLFNPFPFEKVEILLINKSQKAKNTRDLLKAVFNGTTKLKTIEASNLRNKLLDEVMEFQQLLVEYFKDHYGIEQKELFKAKIIGHLNRGSNFTAFKRWIIWNNQKLIEAFDNYID